ncbi:MAG: DUF6306 domain-containing protein, partial [Burkholderiales bacterium]
GIASAADAAAIDVAANEGMPIHGEQCPMSRDDFASLLNQLLEAERAGAKLLSAFLAELPPDSDAWARLHSVQRDEARNCAVLILLLQDVRAEPSMATGDFYHKALAIEDWRERLEFLNRGQAWVARRIGAALPRVPESPAQRALQEMHDSHRENMRVCENLLARGGK